MDHKCPKCGSLKTRSKGVIRRATKTLQDRKCNDCNARWTVDAGREEAPVKNDRIVKTDSVYKKFGGKDFSGVRRFVITSAQNDTETNYEFLKTLETYCEWNCAKLIIIPVRYVNPTIFDRSADQTWDANLVKYMVDEKFFIGENVQVLADMKINATMQSPLNGVDSVTRGKTTILGHAQLQLRSIPRPKGHVPVLATTTGSVSIEQYSNTRVGYIAEFNHSYSAAVVELEEDGRTFHIRHLVADHNNGFYDLGDYYHLDKEPIATHVSAIVLGDEHVGFGCNDTLHGTFSPGGLVDMLSPDYLIRHDIFDCRSVSHHDDQSFFKKVSKSHTNADDLLSELTEVVNYLIETTPTNTVSVIVSSNHDRHLDRYLDTPKSALDVKNATIYTELRRMKLDAIERNAEGENYTTTDPFILWMKKALRGDDRFIFLEQDESFVVEDVELGQHGDLGVSGKFGTLQAYSKLGVKTVTGHRHHAGIEKGAYGTGTTTVMNLGYNKGLTCWTNTHCVVYPNGKRQLINIINGKFRLD